MSELDYAAIAAALSQGKAADLERASEQLGFELRKSDVTKLGALCEANATYGSKLTVALALAVLRRCVLSDARLAWERLDERRSTAHLLAVHWEEVPGRHRITLGITRSYGSKKLSGAWEELAGWKRTLADNRELATAWARRAGQTDRLTLRAGAPRPASQADGDEETGLLSAIAARPGEDGPRLVYADWLEERGDVRGEFIRLHCQDLSGPRHRATRERVEQMLQSSWSNFAGELAPWASKDSFERGLVTSLTMTVAAFAKEGARLFGRYPLRHLEIANTSFTEAQLRQLSDLPHLGLVSSLRIVQSSPSVTRRPLAALASGSHFDRLERLALFSCGHSGADWTALFSALDAPQLEELEFSFNHVHHDLYLALARNPRLPKLKRLTEYRYTELPGTRAEGWRAAFEALAQRPLIEVTFEQSRHLGDDEVCAFFAKHARSRLSRLKLVGARVTDRLLESIVSSPHGGHLESLEVHNGHFSLGAVRTLLQARNLKLERLALTGGYDKDRWSPEDLERLCELLAALPQRHPLKAIGLPAGLNEAHPGVSSLGQRYELLT